MMMSVFCACMRNDLQVMIRSPKEWSNPILFFIIFISLFGIGLGFDSEILMKMSPAIIWIAFLLTSLFTIETLFRNEMEEGGVEQLLLSPYPLWWLILAKFVAIWLVSCLPLILFIPLLGMLMQLSLFENSVLVLGLLIGSPAITMVGMIGAALTISMPRSGMFLGLLLLPLYIPILILGESAVSLLLSSTWPAFQLALLGALSILTVTIAPHAVAAALKVAVD
ncbi:MAG: heme exporter protein CcmB [Gammaproteobacteria bacterium]|nr:heme exporter protein CcmB [Gammaproteobacteria bacterium]